MFPPSQLTCHPLAQISLPHTHTWPHWHVTSLPRSHNSELPPPPPRMCNTVVVNEHLTIESHQRSDFPPPLLPENSFDWIQLYFARRTDLTAERWTPAHVRDRPWCVFCRKSSMLTILYSCFPLEMAFGTFWGSDFCFRRKRVQLVSSERTVCLLLLENFAGNILRTKWTPGFSLKTRCEPAVLGCADFQSHSSCRPCPGQRHTQKVPPVSQRLCKAWSSETQMIYTHALISDFSSPIEMAARPWRW